VAGILESKLQLIRAEKKEMLKSQTTTLFSLSPQLLKKSSREILIAKTYLIACHLQQPSPSKIPGRIRREQWTHHHCTFFADPH
jgi:hypothetical protein